MQAIQPINYLAMTPKIDLGEKFKQGYEIGHGLSEASEAEDLKQQYKTDLQDAFDNPSQKTWAMMIAKYPKQREAFGDISKMYNEDQKTNLFNQGAEISTALESGNVDVAKNKLQTIIDANKAAGKDASIWQNTYDSLEKGDIKSAQRTANFSLAMFDPEKFQKIASSTATAAKTPLEARKLEADTAKIEREMQPDYVAKQEASKKRGALQVELEAARPQAENSLKNLVLSAQEQKNLASKTRDALRNSYGNLTGSIAGRLPSVFQSSADFIADLDRLNAKSLIGTLQSLKESSPTGASGFGSLTEKEGEKLQKSSYNFSPTQSEKKLGVELRRYETDLDNSLNNVLSKFNETYGTKYTIDDIAKMSGTPSNSSRKRSYMLELGM